MSEEGWDGYMQKSEYHVMNGGRMVPHSVEKKSVKYRDPCKAIRGRRVFDILRSFSFV
jgi:hypothetical protein